MIYSNFTNLTNHTVKEAQLYKSHQITFLTQTPNPLVILRRGTSSSAALQALLGSNRLTVSTALVHVGNLMGLAGPSTQTTKKPYIYIYTEES